MMNFRGFLLVICGFGFLVGAPQLTAQDMIKANANSPFCPPGWEYLSGGFCQNTDAINARREAERDRRVRDLVEDTDRLLEKYEKEEASQKAEDQLSSLTNLLMRKPYMDFLQGRIDSDKSVPPETCMEDFVNTSSGIIDGVGISSRLAGLLPGDHIIEQDGRPWGNTTSVKKGEPTSLKVRRGDSELTITFECPFSYGEYDQNLESLYVAIRDAEWHECMYISKASRRFTGRAEFFEQFYVMCLGMVSPRINNHAKFEHAMLSLRYAAHEKATLKQHSRQVESMTKYFTKQNLPEYARQLEEEYAAALNQFID